MMSLRIYKIITCALLVRKFYSVIQISLCDIENNRTCILQMYTHLHYCV